MFGKKKRELEAQIADLAQRLIEKQEECERVTRELDALKERLDLEERTLKELQDACRQKLSDMDGKSRQFEYEHAKIIQETQEESDRQRAELEREIKDNREKAGADLSERVRAFSDNYNYYLSQVKLIMDMLTRAAIKTGESFLTDDRDTTELFRNEMSEGLNSGVFHAPESEKIEEANV